MAEFFIELFSEEIPARMQARAAEDLARLLGEALGALSPASVRVFHGPRRIAYAAEMAPGVAASQSVERGPRRSAPEQALAGFLRKHGADRADLREEGEFWVLHRAVAGVEAATLIADALPGLLRRFPWPKSMRWGGTSQFTWVRPLRRITCLLDGAVVSFDLREGADDGHGLASSNLTEGHRFLSPGTFAVASCAQWQAELRARHVVVDAAERRRLIADALRDKAANQGLAVVDDAGLLDEVTGLVEWPVAMIGRIDAAYMDLPAEVMQVSMRVNQRYFALRDAFGAAPYFAFVANVPGSDGGAAIVAGNERVLRARFADARHFWDLDRTRTLESRVAALDGVTFHAKLGSQGDRVRRIEALAERIAPLVRADGVARRAARLCKADLTTGMVGEFPELQGVMGGYYARHDGEPASVAEAVAQHYQPKGPGDAVPEHPVAVSVALADKIDQLAAFFAIGEKPTGSGDPYALRRAALGVIRIIRERGLRLELRPLVAAASTALTAPCDVGEVTGFVLERLRVQLRAEGARHDVLAAVLGVGLDDDLTRLLARTDAVTALLGTEDGTNLLAAYRRAANILRIEEKKDGPHDGPLDESALEQAEEAMLASAVKQIRRRVGAAVLAEDFTAAMRVLAELRAPLDAFFDKVTVNDPRPELRRNRLRLLHHVRAAMNLAADFSRIEG
ncbi:MAG: glycine--tRNA ligase subunit beta [Rhodospirillales bacterium 70-18]|nr:glycine--tRNA ligase subunit beta [Rhodospirillales bacterium]OJY70289.1 MAG: glycine--tRNA ligase subunit beta [Rhodospirillales bacterium 70-18]